MADDGNPIDFAEARRRKAATWRKRLLVNDKGTPRPLLANAIIALRDAPEWQGRIRFNEFRQQIVLQGSAPWHDLPRPAAAEEDWSDAHDIRVADWLQQHGIYVSPLAVAQAIVAVSAENSFHPVRDYLDGLKWDGTERIETWACAYLGVPDSAFVRAIAARFLISAVARIYEPGCKADHCLILEGQQGIKKSSALRALGEPWFTDELDDLHSKDAAMQIAGVWLVELAELDSLGRAEVSRVKAFLSRTTDRYRPPFGRHIITAPRQCVFAGTVNQDEYLRDETGGRRFWPVVCGEIRPDELGADRDQLWAEACAAYERGDHWWLDTPELRRLAAEEQAARYQADPWQEKVESFARHFSTVSVAEILAQALFRPLEQWTQADANRVARCLKAMGWERFQVRSGGDRKWRYRPRQDGTSPDLSPVEEPTGDNW